MEYEWMMDIWVKHNQKIFHLWWKRLDWNFRNCIKKLSSWSGTFLNEFKPISKQPPNPFALHRIFTSLVTAPSQCFTSFTRWICSQCEILWCIYIYVLERSNHFTKLPNWLTLSNIKFSSFNVAVTPKCEIYKNDMRVNNWARITSINNEWSNDILWNEWSE